MENKLTSEKSRKLSASWKNRKDYHGMKNTKFYNSYRSMITRCNGTAGTDSIKKYRDKGITVCERWNGNFKNFYEDMFSTWSEGLSIDRIDNSKGYSKENCRWSTASEQQNNRTNNARISFNGKTQTLREWSNELGVGLNSLKLRYYNSYKKGKCSIDELMLYTGRRN